MVTWRSRSRCNRICPAAVPPAKGTSMRRSTLVVLFAAAGSLAGGRAFASPFQPSTVPKEAEVVGHLDVDALRTTQIFAAMGGEAAIDQAVEHAPPAVRSVARALARSACGVTFWRDGEHGAVQIESTDGRAVAKLLAKLPVGAEADIDGVATFSVGEGDSPAHVAISGATLVAADDVKSLKR